MGKKNADQMQAMFKLALDSETSYMVQSLLKKLDQSDVSTKSLSKEELSLLSDEPQFKNVVTVTSKVVTEQLELEHQESITDHETRFKELTAQVNDSIDKNKKALKKLSEKSQEELKREANLENSIKECKKKIDDFDKQVKTLSNGILYILTLANIADPGDTTKEAVKKCKKIVKEARKSSPSLSRRESQIVDSHYREVM